MQNPDIFLTRLLTCAFFSLGLFGCSPKEAHEATAHEAHEATTHEAAHEANAIAADMSAADTSGVDAGAEATDAGAADAGVVGSGDTTPEGMALVPGGPFRMGADSGGELDEHPAHTVTLPAFYLDLTEVTNEAWDRCVAAKVCTPPDASSAGRNGFGGMRASGGRSSL